MNELPNFKRITTHELLKDIDFKFDKCKQLSLRMEYHYVVVSIFLFALFNPHKKMRHIHGGDSLYSYSEQTFLT
jgi:hypothetical protein